MPTFPIAIIGAGCRLPGGIENLSSLWSALVNGQDMVTYVPASRWDSTRFTHKDRKAPGRAVTHAAGVIENITDFDAPFFGISRTEAENIDPQQRLVLEMAWEAMENAQILPSALAGSQTGVFIGSASPDFAVNRADDPAIMGPYSMTGSNLSIISNRVSYIFDLHGPSMTIDTACSSALVALHQAVQALQNGLPLAFAGGVNILLTPMPFIGFSKAQMLSQDGRCKVFDEKGNGYVRSEGGGVVLLKPLSAALADGNPILGVVRATGCNSDGRTAGISLPNQAAQAALMEEIYAQEGVDVNRITYVEAHGTGTAAGDPVETGAIGKVLGTKIQGRPLYVGSVKSHVGHLETGSGMAGLFKALCVLEHKQIPANIHFETPNTHIDFAGLNLKVPTSLEALPKVNGPALIGLNSFGFGGTNVHIVLEEAPKATPENKAQKTSAAQKAAEEPAPLFLSAKSRESLQKMAAQYAGLLEHADITAFNNTAYSLAFTRENMLERAIISAPSVAESLTALNTLANMEEEPDPKNPLSCLTIGTALDVADEHKKAAFAFSGNGCQWQGMGAQLYAEDKAFRAALDKVDSYLKPLQGFSLVEEMLKPEAENRLDLTEFAQPLLFALQVGLVEALAAKGIVPEAVYGHSVGEVAAAWASGALSLQDACTVIHFRSALQGQTAGTGTMAAVNITPERAMEICALYPGDIELAGVNSAASITLAGSKEALLEIKKAIDAEKGFCKLLDLNYPFHSMHMAPLEKPLKESLADIKPGKTRIPFISTVTGKAIDGETLNGEYWWHNIRQKVSFHPATETLLDMGFRFFLEIGGHGVLQFYIKDSLRARNAQGVVLPTLRRKEGHIFPDAWRKAIASGFPFQKEAFFPTPCKKIPLPAYPWNKEYLWLAPTIESENIIFAHNTHPLLGRRMPKELFVWENELDTTLFPWLADHKVADSILFPAAAYLECALYAAKTVQERKKNEVGPVELINVALRRPFVLTETPPKRLRLTIHRGDNSFTLESRSLLDASPWSFHAGGRIGHSNKPVPAPYTKAQLDKMRQGKPIEKNALYTLASKVSFQYGPAFQSVKTAWKVDENTILAELSLPTIPEQQSLFTGMLLPPSVVDGAFQTLFLLAAGLMGAENATGPVSPWLPAWFGKTLLYAMEEGKAMPAYSIAKLERVAARSFVASFEILDKAGNTLICMQDVRFRKADMHSHQNSSQFHSFTSVRRPHPSTSPFLPLPSLQSVVDDLAPTMAAIASQPARKRYHEEVLPLCEAATVSLAHELLAPLGKAGAFSLQDGIMLGLLDENFTPFITFMLELLEARGLAQRDVQNGKTRWRVNEESDLPPSVLIWRTLLAEHPGHLPEATLAGRVGLNLRAIVQGAYDPESILSTSLCATAEQYHGNSPSLEPVNTAAVHLLKKMLATLPEGRKLRVLEIGAAPGGLTGLLYAALKDQPDSYRYRVTDKNETALDNLITLCDNDPNTTFGALDIEQLPEDVKPEYHLLLAGHVLHETENIHLALSQASKLLAPGGLIAILERAPQSLVDMVQGIRPSWWNRSATPAEPASRLMLPSHWQNALLEAGFEEVCLLCEPADCIGGIDPDAFLVLGRKSCAEEPAVLPTPTKDAVWAIFIDAEPSKSAALVLEALQERMEEVDCRVLTFAQEDLLAAENTPSNAEKRLQSFLERETGSKPVHVISLAGFDTALPTEKDNKIYAERQHSGVLTLLALTHAWEKAERKQSRVWILTGGAMPITTGNAQIQPQSRLNPSQGATWGFGRVMMNEASGLSPFLIDIQVDLENTANQQLAQTSIDALCAELFAPNGETEVLLQGKARYCPRLAPFDVHPNQKLEEEESMVRLAFDNPGRLDRLFWQRLPKPKVDAGQIRVQTKAVGLNFRDVMWAMGLLPEEALDDGFSGPTMGLEASGIIDEVGESVTNFRKGDEVVCFAPSCFASTIITTENAVAKKPRHVSFEAAATLPVTFFTAWYAIKHLARMEAGQRILIHGAAGGVGLAALQVANYFDLEVFASAGSPEKREFLRLLGVKNIVDSRSLAFADAIMEMTKGEGVDAVLNSLNGDAIEKGLDILRPFGSFLELGKRDFYSDTPMHLRHFRNNISYYGIDVDQLLVRKPELARQLFGELMALFEDQSFHPLPYRMFSRVETVEAFRVMQQSRHLGKLVVSMDETERLVRPYPPEQVHIACHKNAAYLVTGGLGGFGLESAKRLAQNGAGHLLLMGRKGFDRSANPEHPTEIAIKAMEAMGATVHILAADVTDKLAVQNALNLVLGALGSKVQLAGILHAATVMDDTTLINLTPSRTLPVLDVKALGAWNLHTISLAYPLDFFILYSSATTALGNPGQGNYVAANTALEALAAWRNHQGLPGITVGFGPISDVGMLTRNTAALDSLQNVLGVAPLTSQDALDALEQAVSTNITGLSLFAMDWKKTRHLPIAHSPKLERMRHDLKDEGAGTRISPMELIKGKNKEEAIMLLATRVGEEVANILRMPATRLSLEKPVADLGMDSLMAVELGLALEEAFGMEIPSFSLSGGASVLTIAERLYLNLTAGTEEKNQPAPSENEQLVKRMQEQHGVNPEKGLTDQLIQTLNKTEKVGK